MVGVGAIYGAQVDIYILLWAAYASTVVLCLHLTMQPGARQPTKKKSE